MVCIRSWVQCFHDPQKLKRPSVSGLVKNALDYEDTTLEASVSETLLSDEERNDFVSFLRSMLKYEPDERATAKQLLEHAWLVEDYDSGQYECS